jgi:hypothetical protein
MRCPVPTLVVFLVIGAGTFADHPDKGDKEKAVLFSEKGRRHLAISTKNREAQAFFDQGMTLHYGFNHMEAVRSFRRAAELDPKSPMPWWGIGLSLGPNYNRDIDPVDEARNKAAFEATQTALGLIKNARKGPGARFEQALFPRAQDGWPEARGGLPAGDEEGGGGFS